MLSNINVQMLPKYIECLGRKLNKFTDLFDRLFRNKAHNAHIVHDIFENRYESEPKISCVGRCYNNAASILFTTIVNEILSKITYIIHSQGIRLALLALLSPHTSITGTLPPFVVQHLDFSLFLKLEDCQRYLISPW